MNALVAMARFKHTLWEFLSPAYRVVRRLNFRRTNPTSAGNGGAKQRGSCLGEEGNRIRCIEGLRKLDGKRRQCTHHRNACRDAIQLRAAILAATISGISRKGIIDLDIVCLGMASMIHCPRHYWNIGFVTHLVAGQFRSSKRLAGESQ